MSYDVSLHMNTGKEDVEIPGTESNYTYNIFPMLKLAFDEPTGINVLEGSLAKNCIGALTKAVRHMEDFPATHLAYNPLNGWGSYEGCLRWLRNILSHCEQHPLATLRIT